MNKQKKQLSKPSILSKESIDYISKEFEKLPVSLNKRSIIDVVESARIVSGAFPGLYSYSRTPYMIEPIMLASSKSEYRQITVMASAQSGKTSGLIENFLLYCTELGDPCNVLYMSATSVLVKDFVQEIVDPMYREAGVKYVSDVNDFEQFGAAKKTGNTTFKKSGKGWLHIFKSFGSIREVRSLGFKVILLDEVDEIMQTESQHHQGSFKKIIEARTHSYSGREKIILCSTPLVATNSIIYAEFLKGDRRYCHIPCPYCGHYQKIEFKNLKWEFSDEERNRVNLNSVYLECVANKCKIKNCDKVNFLTRDKIKWIPENPDSEPLHASFHFSALYCPPGMLSWESIAQDFVDSKGNPNDLQAFTNLKLGEPFHEVYNAQKPEMLHALKGNYTSNKIPQKTPDGHYPVIATMGVDVQGDRLELELLGHGVAWRTWSLGYYVLEGETSSHSTGAWVKLRELLSSKKLCMQPFIVCIDSSFLVDVVRQFCNGSMKLRPIQGEVNLRGDKFRKKNLIGYGAYGGGPLEHYDLDTNYYKKLIYKNLLLRQDEKTGNIPPGYCYFPRDYDIKYFRGLQSEVQEPIFNKKTGRITGYQFVLRGKRNEPLDCRVYALAGLDILANNLSIYYGKKNTDWGFFYDTILKRQ